jgi:hypothetical protein
MAAGPVNMQYTAEVRPVLFENDPITDQKTVILSPPPVQTYINNGPLPAACHAFTQRSSSVINGVTYTEDFTQGCPGTRWTYGFGLSPIGFKTNFLPQHRLQPILTGLVSFMVSANQVPMPGASRFNFAFQFGGGVEYFTSSTRSIRVEWRYHHISNAGTARSCLINGNPVATT